MKRYLAVLVCVFALFAGSASACDVAVQSFGVQSFCAPQVQSFAVQQYAVAVPLVQTYSVQAFAAPVCAQQVFVQNVGHDHHHGRQRLFSQRQQSTQVIRSSSRTVIRNR